MLSFVCNPQLLAYVNYTTKVTKTGRLKWLGDLLRMQDTDLCRKLAVLKTKKQSSACRKT